MAKKTKGQEGRSRSHISFWIDDADKDLVREAAFVGRTTMKDVIAKGAVAKAREIIRKAARKSGG